LNSDIPVDFRVTLLKNAGHPFGVLRSKGALRFIIYLVKKINDLYYTHAATGEPPLAMSASVFFALKNAVSAARSDAGNPDWFPMGKIFLLLLFNFNNLIYLFRNRWASYR